MKEKCNVVLTFSEDSYGLYTLKIYNNEIVYQNNRSYDGHEVGELAEQLPHKVTLTKGKCRVILKEVDPWHVNSFYKYDVGYEVEIKWTPINKTMIEMVEPEKPTLSAKYHEDTGKVELTWSQAENADCYKIYRTD